ncbi:NACHT domain-containing protein [Streptomyces lasiicapitis]|uniref:NACHT domain-containing protein n=1 Tax=Streptomyces lasiicapitis TaxID=1923961 RepID=UPI0036475099
MDAGMRGGGGLRWLFGGGVAVLVVGCGWAAVVVRRDVLEPPDVAGVLGLPLGILGILLGAAVSVRALRLQQATDARAVALERLARAVQDVEVAERTHMLGTGGHLIDLPVDVTPRQGGAEPAGRQRLSDVAQWYSADPGRLVVTGEPGAGKTVFAVHLVVRLLDARAATDPVPVRLAIRDLPPARTRRRWWGGLRTVGGFEHWLKDSLVKAYEVPEAAAADLVARRLVVPVLDGLDEMDPDEEEPTRASQALAELNAHQGVGGSAPLVLTCRGARYEELSARHAWLREATLLCVGGVDAEQARCYVNLRSDGRTSPMDPVVDAMRDGTAGGAVAEALSSPFYLGLAFAVYGESADVAPPADGATAGEIREQLLARYVPAATRSANAAVRRARRSLSGDRTVWGRLREYEAERVHGWLERMAWAAEADGVTLGRVVGRPLTAVASVIVALAAAACALWVVPDAIRGLVPDHWWVHRENLATSLWIAVLVAFGMGRAHEAALCEWTPLASSERVRQPYPAWPGRLRKALLRAVSRNAVAVAGMGVLVLGAAAPFTAAYEAVPQPGWYVLGMVLVLSGCVIYAENTRFVAYTDRRGLIACVLVPLFFWPVAWAFAEVHPLLRAACLLPFVTVVLLLWHRGVVPGIALLSGGGAVVLGWSRASLAPSGGFESGAEVGLLAFYVFACGFLTPGSGPRVLDAVGRLRRRTAWLTRPVGFGLAFLAGVAGEAWLGFAGVVYVAVVATAAELAVGLATALTVLAGAALGRVPPSPGAFLAWAYHAGLLRVVGGEYQFRHRELQEWLARGPR